MSIKRYAKYLVATIICVCILFVFIFFIVLYPIKYKNEILNYSDEYGLRAELVASIINVESSYNKKAISNSGAVGLMQIMPSTAQEIANELNFLSFDLEDAETNICFGCFYIKKLLSKYTNEATALAAYNAGPKNVDEWLRNPRFSDDGISLKHIPFHETRNYIRKIFVYRTFYTNLFNF